MKQLRLVSTANEIRANILTFNRAPQRWRNLALDIVRSTHYFVYDPDLKIFGPSKFVVYQNIDLLSYQKARDEKTAGRFDGNLTRRKIERVLTHDFWVAPELSDRLERWSTKMFGRRALERVDRSKWRFVSLPRYWALVMNPRVFYTNLTELGGSQISWTAARGNIEVGDEVLFWQSKARRSEHREIVALGTVIRGPHLARYIFGEGWKRKPTAKKVRWIEVQIKVPQGLPIEVPDGPGDLLSDLNVARSRGGSVFPISASDWEQIMIRVEHSTRTVDREFEKEVDAIDIDGALDSSRQAAFRREQQTIRKRIFGSRTSSPCLFCRRELPIELLVAAHIKRRSSCSRQEKLDFRSNVIALCSLGCDALFERGFIFVDDSGRLRLNRNLLRPRLIGAELSAQLNQRVEGFDGVKRLRFAWHRRFHCRQNVSRLPISLIDTSQ